MSRDVFLVYMRPRTRRSVNRVDAYFSYTIPFHLVLKVLQSPDKPCRSPDLPIAAFAVRGARLGEVLRNVRVVSEEKPPIRIDG